MERDILSIKNFQEYVKIKSVQPNPDYVSCVKWLKRQACELKADDFTVTECVPGKPIVIISVFGKDPSLPSILLNSHMDVVPVFKEHWKCDPFEAHIDELGNIYGRGTQDMKCVGVQYLEAMKRLKSKDNNTLLLRNVHILFVPDEEIGGHDGMCKFVATNEFKNLNIGFGLDEGYASQNDDFYVFYGERNIWQFWVKCSGTPGHGSQFIADNAGVKLQKVINSIMNFRNQEEQRLKDDSHLSLGDVTSINLTMLQGGVQFNVIPSELSVGFDVRLPPSVIFDDFLKKIQNVCQEAGDNIKLEFVQKGMVQGITSVKDGENKWWDTFSDACKRENVTLKKAIFPAGTDSRYLRNIGIPALGFSPMNRTPLLLHDHNEFLNDKIFLRGINIYETLITALANIQ